MIEIPPCADRVEIQGQAQRLSPTRFELDHSFDFMLSRTQLSFRAGGDVRDLFVASTQPDPLRLFFGIGAGVVGGLLLLNGADGLSQDQDILEARPWYATIGGALLLAAGTATAVTGWHPPQRYLTWPDACPDQPRAAPSAAAEPMRMAAATRASSASHSVSRIRGAERARAPEVTPTALPQGREAAYPLRILPAPYLSHDVVARDTAGAPCFVASSN